MTLDSEGDTQEPRTEIDGIPRGLIDEDRAPITGSL